MFSMRPSSMNVCASLFIHSDIVALGEHITIRNFERTSSLWSWFTSIPPERSVPSLNIGRIYLGRPGDSLRIVAGSL